MICILRGAPAEEVAMTVPTVEQDFARWRARCDPRALERVFDALAPELLVIAHHVAGAQPAEDLVQATFLAAIQHGDRWDAARPLLPWLIGILVRHALRERERLHRRPDPRRLPVRSTPDPAEVAEAEELAAAVDDALRQLPKTYRQTLALRLVHGLTPTEIAHALGEPIATVKSRLARGRELLRRALPAGVHAPGAAFLTGMPLEQVRAEILNAAARHASFTAATTTAAVAPSIGIAIMTPKLMLSATAGLALTGALALAWWVPHARLPDPETPAQSQTPATVVAPPGAPDTPAAAASADPRVALAPATSTADDATEAGAFFHGRVVDENGQGIAGVTVLLGLPGRTDALRSEANFLIDRSVNTGEIRTPEDGAKTATAADGGFRFRRPDDAMHRALVAWSAELGCARVELPPEHVGPIDITLARGEALAGTLRDATTQQPIADTHVSFYPERSGMPIAWPQTDALGRFRTPPLPVQGYRAIARPDGFVEVDQTVPAGQRELLLEADPLPRLDAVLANANGTAWTAARIADALGGDRALRFELTARPYDRYSALTADHFDRARLELELELEPDTGSLRGAVIDTDARHLSVWDSGKRVGQAVLDDWHTKHILIELAPEPTVRLGARIHLDPTPRSAVEIEATLTDGLRRSVPLATARGDGLLHFDVPSHLSGHRCGLLIEADGYAEHFAMLEIPTAATEAWYTATLSPAEWTAHGQVLGPAGGPPTAATVTVLRADGTPLLRPERATVLPRDDGLFRFEGLPRAPVWVMVQADGCAAHGVEISADTTEPVTVELAASRELEIQCTASSKKQYRILDAQGRPLLDDRWAGVYRFGHGTHLDIGARAATVEVYDTVSGELLGSGAVPANDALEIRAHQ